MAFARFALVAALVLIGIQKIHGHGKLMDPVNRSSAWRKGFKVPMNYDDNENFCGGLNIQMKNEGKCGPCGDNYSDPQPRNNENGGFYGTGNIVKRYKKGENTTIVVNLSANHMGHFEFSVCPLNGRKDIESEECFDKHPVKLANGSYKYPVEPDVLGDFVIEIVLPEDVTCEHCAFRWHYRSGNNWGICEGDRGAVGCGPQETFRGCSDISIL